MAIDMKTAATAIVFAFGISACATTPESQRQNSGLGNLAKVAQVDERFQSYNVEMVEVTGGRFWAPYGGPSGEMYRMRPPENLANPRLRALARHLGPAYMRVSGTWANSTYLPAEGEVVTSPPEGFNQVLSRDQWRGVVAFAKAVDAKIVTSFVASPGGRAADGSWKPEQAQRLLDLTRESGGSIHSAELFNEPTIPTHGAFPKDYTPTHFARDFRIFRAWASKAAPEMKLTGPGGVSEGTMMKKSESTASMGLLSSDDLLSEMPGAFDIFSYHFYGTVSQRCGTPPSQKDQALTPAWLDVTLTDQAHYAALRDRYAPGKSLWLNETAQAACGGSPWAKTYLDTFRYLNQLGALAQKGVQVVIHNTLAASDYALLDPDTHTPRPNYWSAVLWRRTMGSTVLAAPAAPTTDVRVYAHCLRDKPGGVGLLAINTGDSTQSVPTTGRAQAWVMNAATLDSPTVLINGMEPRVAEDGSLIGLNGIAAKDSVLIPAKGIAFIAAPDADNGSCR